MMKDLNRKDSYTKKISLWLDDELNPTEVTELKAHLAGCSTCRQTYEAMRRVDHLLHTAATVMAVPSSGFVERFEMRLVQYRPDKPWRIWLALGGLLLGTLFVFSAWAIVGGVALVGVSISLLDVGLLYQWLATFIESVDMLRGYVACISQFRITFLEGRLYHHETTSFLGCWFCGPDSGWYLGTSYADTLSPDLCYL
jgi:hypothetical protein